MNCPYYGKEIMAGSISQDRHTLKWVPCDKNMGILNSASLMKGVKLTSMTDKIRAKVFYCEEYRKFLIDQDDLRVSN